MDDRDIFQIAQDDKQQQGAQPKIPNLDQLVVIPQDLQQAQAKKKALGFIGGMGDALANSQSAGNFYLGRMNPHQDVSGGLKSQMDAADQAVKNKQTLMAQAMQEPDRQRMVALLDKDSDESKAEKAQLAAAYDAMGKAGLFKNSPDTLDQLKSNVGNLNGHQAMRLASSPIVKDFSQMAMAEMKNDAMAKRMAIMQANQDRNFGMKQDNQAKGAAEDLDKNPLLQASQRQINQIGIDKHTLQSTDVITPQMVHEIGAGIAAALNQGKQVGLGQMEMQDMATSQTKIAQLEQMLTNAPKNGASPEIRQQMIDTLNRLEDSYRKVQAQTAKQIAVGRNYAHNPAAQAALQDKINSYSKAPGDSSLGGMPSAAAGDNDMVDVTSPEGVKGSIPRKNLDKAVRRGFKPAQ
jgi:hypothetical protein